MTIDQKIDAMNAKLIAMGVDTSIDWHSKDSVETIQAAVCVAFSISYTVLVGGSRTQHSSYARFASIWFCRTRHPEMSTGEIGIWHGRRDHGTVMHATKRFNDLLEYPPFKQCVERVKMLLDSK